MTDEDNSFMNEDKIIKAHHITTNINNNLNSNASKKNLTVQNGLNLIANRAYKTHNGSNKTIVKQ